MNTVLFENKLYVEERKEWTLVHIRLHEKEKSVARRWYTSPWRPCIDWCEKRFGCRNMNYLPMVWCYNGGGEFEFQNEEDAVLFALRWA